MWTLQPFEVNIYAPNNYSANYVENDTIYRYLFRFKWSDFNKKKKNQNYRNCCAIRNYFEKLKCCARVYTLYCIYQSYRQIEFTLVTQVLKINKNWNFIFYFYFKKSLKSFYIDSYEYSFKE
jgi:hypothetical protein